MPQPANAVKAKPTTATIKIGLTAFLNDSIFIGSPFF
jgi:hypothetical protein